MDRQRYIQLVSRLEQLAIDDPKRYRLRVRLMVLLGYSYIVLMLTLTVGLCVWIIRTFGWDSWWFLIYAAVIPLVILRALCGVRSRDVRIRVRPQQVPMLWNLVQDVAQQVGAPSPNRLVLVDDFNAYAGQVPRLGIFGWYRNELILGLPMMLTISPASLRVILAHELGHFSANHGRFFIWVYRVHSTWTQIADRLKGQRIFAAPLLAFACWYEPRLTACAFAMLRTHEQHADLCAMQVSDPSSIRTQMFQMVIGQHRVERCQERGLWRGAADEPEPPTDVYDRMARGLMEPVDEVDLWRWIDQAMRQRTGPNDTHPAFRDRLEFMGGNPPDPDRDDPRQWVVDPTQSAARGLLGERYAALSEQLGRRWAKMFKPVWQTHHRRLTRSRKLLQTIDQRRDSEDAQTLLWRFELSWGLVDEDDRLFMLQRAAHLATDSARVNYTLGCVLLARRQDPAGIEYLHRAIEREPMYMRAGLPLLAEFYKSQGQLDEAEDCTQLMQQRERDLAKAIDQRERLRTRDRFETDDLPPRLVDLIVQQLAEYPPIKRVDLVRKQVDQFPETPYYVMLVERRARCFALERSEEAEHYAARLQEELLLLPSFTAIVVLTGQLKWLRRKVRKISLARIYPP